jgi:uncharacterized protein
MITKENIEEVTRRLVDTYQPVAIYLFGSYAWGEPNEDSDIDLMVIVDEKYTSEWEYRIKGNRALAGVGISVDFLFNTPSDFQKRAKERPNLEFLIKKKGIKVYENIRGMDIQVRA